MRAREAAERAEREFVRGEDVELREHQEQLSFNYLPERIAEKWFTLRDPRSSARLVRREQ